MLQLQYILAPVFNGSGLVRALELKVREWFSSRKSLPWAAVEEMEITEKNVALLMAAISEISDQESFKFEMQGLPKKAILWEEEGQKALQKIVQIAQAYRVAIECEKPMAVFVPFDLNDMESPLPPRRRGRLADALKPPYLIVPSLKEMISGVSRN